MKTLAKVSIPSNIIIETNKALRTFGEEECEGLVLWLGHTGRDNTKHVEKILVPPQDSIKSEDGVGYFVTSETLFSLNRYLSETGLRLLAQVHSHPGRAYHSTADDRYCIVTTEGGFSIVVPNFGFGPSDIFQWAVYQLINGAWEGLTTKQVKTLFSITGKPDDDNAGGNKISIRI